MLGTIREYAWERLEASGEAAAIQRQHAAYMAALAEEAAPRLTGAAQVAWLTRLETEHDNMRAALRWARRSGQAELGLRLAGALWRFWERHGHLGEGRAWLEALLALDEQADRRCSPAVRATALHGASALVNRQGEYERAMALCTASLDLWRRLGDNEGIATALNTRGVIAHHQGDCARAIALYEESLALRRDRGDTWGISATLLNLGLIMQDRGDYGRATDLYEASAALKRELRDTWGLAFVLRMLGWAAHAREDYALAMARYAESLPVFEQFGDRWNVAACLEHMAGVLCAQGCPARAAHLWGACAVLQEQSGAPVPKAEQDILERARAAARAALGAATFDALWAEGRTLAPEQAIALARATTPDAYT